MILVKSICISSAKARHEEIYKKLGAHVTQSRPHQRRRVRRLGAARRERQRRRRLQRLGRHATTRCNSWATQASGNCSFPNSPPAVSTSLRSARQTVRRFSKPILTRSTRKFRPTLHRSSIDSKYKFRDAKWMKNRAGSEHFRQPLSIYEVHFGSWRRKIEDEQSSFHLSRNGRAARRLRRAKWASRTSSFCR